MVTQLPDPQALLEALDEDQRLVAQQVTGPLCVLAGAGTGKTRAITYRIAYGAASGAFDPVNLLAVTFTSRAAGEMRQRLAGLGVGAVQARTFHSAALSQLSYFWPTAIGGRRPDLIESKASLIASACGRLSLPTDRVSVRDFSAEVEWSKVMLVGPQEYETRIRELDRPTPGGQDAAKIAALLRVYEDCKRERGVIDFEDVLQLTTGMLVEREDIARHVRAQYRHFVVDEYQDVSPLQQVLLEQWLGGRNDICVVGDVAQTIYSFAGADPRFLTDFAARHQGAKTLQLYRDYRSTPQVVTVANQVLSLAVGADGKPLVGTVRLQAQRPSGPKCQFTAYVNDMLEAEGVLAQVKKLHAQGVPLEEIAVLYRTNAQSQAFEEAFAKAGISVILRGGQRFFEREEIRRLMFALRVAVRQGENDADLFFEMLRAAQWREEAPKERGATRERWENLDAVAKLGRARFENGASFVEVVTELEERAATSHVPAVAGVTLATLHAAKGLEWDAVFLVGTSEGLLPISMAQTPADLEEERRLLYVGVTRARQHLSISYAQHRGSGASRARKRSRFLDSIWPTGGRSVSRAVNSHKK